jgi:CrcB protein
MVRHLLRRPAPVNTDAMPGMPTGRWSPSRYPVAESLTQQEFPMPTLSSCLIVAFGGALGTIARYLISIAGLPFSRDLPLSTILINVTGSFVIGLFGTLTLADGRFPASENVRLFVMVGLCGGYTTFSAFSLQTLDLLRSGSVVRAAVNVAASVCLCILAVALGYWIASRWNGGQPRSAHMTIDEESMPRLVAGQASPTRRG